MEQISTYTVPAGLDALLAVRETGTLPRELYEPMQALVRHFTSVAAERPVYAYLFSDEADAERRDLFAYALMRTLLQHIPSALLVDCDFLGSGMHGIVPEKDALGFLDFLLYGSSLGVITQETTGGVRVIGPGSFPVTRKMPFVPDAFREASYRLVNHARCVIFVGPLYDDEGAVHPLVGMADLPVFVRDNAEGRGGMAPIEESIAAGADRELISVRVGGEPFEPELARPELAGADRVEEPESRFAAPPPQEPAAPPPTHEPPPDEQEPIRPAMADTPPVAPLPPLDETIVDTVRGRPSDPRIPARPDDTIPEEPRYTSLVPRLLTALVALMVIVFIAWWFLQERQFPGLPTLKRPPGPATETAATPEPVVTASDEGDATAVTDTMATAPVTTVPEPEPEPEPVATTTPPPAPAPTAVSLGPLSAEDIHVMAELTDGYPGWYVIHISSFRESSKAREEATYLSRQGFPVFIVFLDLGAKGKWYRIYSGPFETREESREVKKNLDEIPRVRFTRISKVTP